MLPSWYVTCNFSDVLSQRFVSANPFSKCLISVRSTVEKKSLKSCLIVVISMLFYLKEPN